MLSEKSLINILDIDLDFFLNEKHNGIVTSTERVDATFFKQWTKKQVVNFLGNNCRLKKENKIHGKCFVHHVEAFYFLRELQENNNFSFTFNIDHVDAHADLGMGDASYKYIASEILHKPIKERAYPDKVNGWEGLSSGNFLAFAVACRWIETLKYINNEDWFDDIAWFNLKNFELEENTIQLKKYSKEQMQSIIYGRHSDMRDAARSIPPMEFEPEVPFEIIDYTKFKSSGNYDYIFLTQSPGFTPSSSDKLIPVIKDYMRV